jgi:hypothetical protein
MATRTTGRAPRPSFARVGFKRSAPGYYVHVSGSVAIEFYSREEGDAPGWQIMKLEDGAVVDWDGLYPRLIDALASETIGRWVDA